MRIVVTAFSREGGSGKHHHGRTRSCHEETYRISYGFCIFPWTKAGGQRCVHVYEIFAN